MEFCSKRRCPFEDCEHHPSRAPRGFAYTARDMDTGCERLADYRTNEKYIQDRINRMTTGDAYIIFQNIDNDTISVEEKAAAIREIVGLETHNGVTKAMMLKVIRWLLELSFDIQEGDDDTGDDSMRGRPGAAANT